VGVGRGWFQAIQIGGAVLILLGFAVAQGRLDGPEVSDPSER